MKMREAGFGPRSKWRKRGYGCEKVESVRIPLLPDHWTTHCLRLSRASSSGTRLYLRLCRAIISWT